MQHVTQHNERHAPGTEATRRLSTGKLLSEFASKATLLVEKEVTLARTELKSQLRAELTTLKGLAVAVVAALLCLNSLLIAAVLALAAYMAPVPAALCVAGLLLLVTTIAGGVAWRKHVRRPLEVTQHSLKEDVQWAKEELA